VLVSLLLTPARMALVLQTYPSVKIAHTGAHQTFFVSNQRPSAQPWLLTQRCWLYLKRYAHPVLPSDALSMVNAYNQQTNVCCNNLHHNTLAAFL